MVLGNSQRTESRGRLEMNWGSRSALAETGYLMREDAA